MQHTPWIATLTLALAAWGLQGCCDCNCVPDRSSTGETSQQRDDPEPAGGCNFEIFPDPDQDGDGYDDGWFSHDDCDDDDPDTHPGAIDDWGDGVDQNCDGVDGTDGDEDGFAGDAHDDSYDCNDFDDEVYPGAPEECDGIDSDCADDEEDEQDLDADGFRVCHGDCDDLVAETYPGARELCDQADNDCDGVVEDDLDEDGDGLTICDGDCDDEDPEVGPDDHDGDGVTACDGDCDEHDPTIYPGAPGWESADVDRNCDGVLGTPLEEAADAAVEPYVDTQKLGAALAAGDWDGDGLDDLVLGAPAANGWSGLTYLVAGRPAGGWPFSPDDADVWIGGETVYDQSGSTVASGGDLDGDGLDDLAIGAPYHDASGDDSGAAYVVLGRTGGWPMFLTGADAALTGEAANDRAGAAVAMGPDVDGDGLDDLLVGAPYQGSGGFERGKAYLLLGRDGGWDTSLAGADAAWEGQDYLDRTGATVAVAHDLNGDGLGDLVIGAPGVGAQHDLAGTVHLVLGRLGSWPTSLALADATLSGEAAEDRFGASLAAAGDLDGDGLADLVVGAPESDIGGVDSGVAYVFLGRASGWPASALDADIVLPGEAALDGSGASLATGADIDGDGLHDLLIGADGVDDLGNDAGAAYLVLGGQSPWPAGLWEADARFLGAREDGRAGAQVAAVGDADGDGYGDLLVGSPGGGPTYLLLGRPLP